MTKFKYSLLVATLVLTFLPTAFISAADIQPLTTVFNQSDTIPEVHIDKQGNVTINGAKVMQLAGSNFYTRLIWGDAFIRLLVKGGGALISRRFGGMMDPSEIKVGDYLNMTGNIESGSDSFIIKATAIKDISDQREMNQFAGTITAFSTTTSGFILSPKAQPLVQVNVGTTTEIDKGSRIINLSSIKVGDTVTSITGVFNRGTNIMDAEKVRIFVDMNTFLAKNFQGKLLSMKTVSLPTSVVVNIDGKDYNVNLNIGAQILTNNRKNTVLSRFVSGDTVRIYGAIQESDDPVINASIIRNIDI